MIDARVEQMLDQLTQAQNRIVVYLSVGFVFGFSIGVVAAWMMVSIAR
jgi:hypothetical protein